MVKSLCFPIRHQLGSFGHRLWMFLRETGQDASSHRNPPHRHFQRGTVLGSSTYRHLFLIGRNQSFGSRRSTRQSPWSFVIETTLPMYLSWVGVMELLLDWSFTIAGLGDLLRFVLPEVNALTDGKRSPLMS